MAAPSKPSPRPTRATSGPSAGWTRSRSELSGRGWDRRAIWIGIICTLLVHLVLWVAAPHFAVLTQVPVNTNANRSFLIELSPNSLEATTQTETLPITPPPPDKFVEVNPDAPANVPDETRNFGAQDQQLAQPEPTPLTSEGDAPASQGEDENPGAAIVEGQLAPRALPVVAPPPSAAPAGPDEPAAEDPAKLERIARPGVEAVNGDSSDGLATSAGERPGTALTQVDGAADGRPDGFALLSGRVHIDRNKPQSRPVLPTTTGTARPAPLLKNPFGTKNIGAIGYDAKWSDYGAYLQKLIETVQVQWERQITMSSIYPVPGTKIIVTFILNQKGEVDKIVKVDGSNDQTAAALCMNAIIARAPYGDWSEDMIGVLGESQEITFSFHYR